MPVIHREVVFADLTGAHWFQADAVVDSAATFSQIPPEVADQLGLEQVGTHDVFLGDGTHLELPLCNALVSLAEMGSLRATIVSVGHPGAPIVLGVRDLDGFGLGVDTEGERLIPKVSLLLSQTNWPTI